MGGAHIAGAPIMKMTRINPPGVLNHPGFTRVITLEGPTRLAFFSGQTPQGDDMECVAPGDFKAQYMFVMEKLELQLKAVGCSWDNVVVRRLYIKDQEGWEQVRNDPSLPRYFGDMPCSTAIRIPRLSHPDFAVEVEIIAALPD